MDTASIKIKKNSNRERESIVKRRFYPCRPESYHLGGPVGPARLGPGRLLPSPVLVLVSLSPHPHSPSRRTLASSHGIELAFHTVRRAAPSFVVARPLQRPSWILALGSLPQVRNRFHRARVAEAWQQGEEVLQVSTA